MRFQEYGSDCGEMIHSAGNPLGQWNVYEVYAEDGLVATVLNGKLIGLGSNASVSTGYIGLQSEGVPAEFRNIRIKRLRRATGCGRLRKRPSGESPAAALLAARSGIKVEVYGI